MVRSPERAGVAGSLRLGMAGSGGQVVSVVPVASLAPVASMGQVMPR